MADPTPTPTKHRHMDILTQMQDELDMLLVQMHSALRQIRERAPPAAIPGQPLLSTFAEFESQNNPNAAEAPAVPAPVTKESFAKDLREVSRDIVIKEQQIEALIANLPGLSKTEEDQVRQMRELERQLKDIEGERLEAVRERERLIRRIEEKLAVEGMG